MTTPSSLTVLLVGGTGSVGRHAADRALAGGHSVRVLTRDASRAPAGTEAVSGDLTDPSSLAAAVDGIDAVVFTHGSHSMEQDDYRRVDYGGVRSVLEALGDREVRIALMTAVGVTFHESEFNRQVGIHDWKRRAERLVRASGHPYTIVRPSWFDRNAEDERHLVFLQGDTRRNGSPEDGVISREQIGQVLVDALTSEAAAGTTLELVAEQGPGQEDLEPLFAALDHDTGIDGVRDAENLPLADEPDEVRADLEAVRR